MAALDEKEREAPEGQVTPDETAGLLRTGGKFGCPSHFEETRCTLRLQGRVVEGQQLPTLRFLVQQQENASRTNVERMRFSRNDRHLLPSFLRPPIQARRSHWEPCIDAALGLGVRTSGAHLVVHSAGAFEGCLAQRVPQRLENSVDKM